MKLIELAKMVKAKLKVKDPDFKPFKDHTLGMIFAKDSSRTRVSFETGFTRLGGHAIFLSNETIGLGKREETRDIARVFSGYVDIIMARLYKHDDMLELAKNSTIPVINGLTDYNHPCQIMADFLTISEILGKSENFKFVYVGDGNNMAHSFLRMAAVMPFELIIACPLGYEPDEATWQLASKANKKVRIVYDPIEAV